MDIAKVSDLSINKISSDIHAGSLKLAVHNPAAAHSIISKFLKRSIDLLISLSVVIGFAPVFAILIILVSLDGGPAFYAQSRVGRGGRLFQCLKFRTMVVNAEQKLEQLLANDEKARQEYATFRKLKDDPRVTAVGRFLRRYSLDELPQLLNVIKGDMSIVGPRPRFIKDMEFFETIMPEVSQTYKMVKPGLTCLWQISGRNRLGAETRGWLDAYYATNWSIAGDLAIIVATFGVVIRGKGAF
jgi:lipopolysaccharide/colanic/teichoic acid biosynthesis glycosyltransferase